MTIEERYLWACATTCGIGPLIPVLLKYGKQCEHITEFGVRDGVSTSAWLMALPKKLICYDVGRYPSVDEIERLARENGIAFTFREENTSKVFIAPTDLLFIDTVHNYHQLNLELSGNHTVVSKFIILHDTETYGIIGEGGAVGMWYCLIPFLSSHPEWKILEQRPESNGLTVLTRIAHCP